MVKHLACILHQHEGDHQRKSFRNCTDDDDNCQRKSPYNIFDNRFNPHCQVLGNSARLHNKVSKVKYGNQNRTDITKRGNLFCKFGKFYFQRRIRLVFLHLFCHFSHHGLQSDLAYIKNTFAVKYHCSAEQGVCIDKGVACDVIFQLKIL